MIEYITHFLTILFLIHQLKSQISQIDQNGYITFYDESLKVFSIIQADEKQTEGNTGY